jgi:hypothetical protein
MKYDAGIDKHNLDNEAVAVPALFDMFSSKEAEASELWDALKDKMKVLQADVSLKIRGMKLEDINSMFNLELPKVTEEVFKQLVFIHPEVIKLYNEIAEARYQAKMYASARKSIEEKAARLDNLAKLHGQGYFMKIEGRPFKKVAADTILEKAKSATIERLAKKERSITETPHVKKTLKTAKPKSPGRIKI